jgi:DNA-binding CsgD family transcriptional regulator
MRGWRKQTNGSRTGPRWTPPSGTLVGGETVVDPEVVGMLISSSAHPRLLDTLTKREPEVLQLMGEGRSNHGIAHALSLSVKTIKTHVEHILDKLGIEASPGEHRRVLAVLELLRAGDELRRDGVKRSKGNQRCGHFAQAQGRSMLRVRGPGEIGARSPAATRETHAHTDLSCCFSSSLRNTSRWSI